MKQHNFLNIRTMLTVILLSLLIVSKLSTGFKLTQNFMSKANHIKNLYFAPSDENRVTVADKITKADYDYATLLQTR